MASEDSDDEPLSVLLESKKLVPAAFVAITLAKDPKKKKRKRSKRLPVTIDLVPALKNLMAPQVVQRPEDVWLYLKDFKPAGPYSCLLCPEWFINRSKMVVHYILNHKKDFCGICRYFVADRESWLNHLTFHSPWGCSQCSEIFDVEADLRQHFKDEHNLVHCRLCHFLVPHDDQYLEHLLKRHSVANINAKDMEFFWELDPDGCPKFDCLLCLKSGISSANYFNHYFCYHHFSLKSFTGMVSGKDILFTIAGVKVSPHFIETQLKDQKKFGYVDLDWKSEKDESDNENENSVLLEALIPEVKQEVTSDNDEEPSTQIPEKKEDDNNLPEFLKSYKGEVDFDITRTELVILQKCCEDYINDIQVNLNHNKVPDISDINYEQSKTDSEQNFDCTICSKSHENLANFSSHMSRMHGVKTMPLYSCRVCLSPFDSLQDLKSHSIEELDDFQDLWICQFCDKEFDNRELTRRHLSDHFSTMDVDNCFSPHLGFKCRYCPTLFWNEPEREQHQVRVHFKDHIEDYFKCESCPELFSERTWFVHHYRDVHAAPPWLLKCALCSATARDVPAARAHFRAVHADARKLYCDVSPCRFRPLAHRRTFKIHLKSIHGGGARLPCAECARVFRSQRARRAHAAAAHARAGFRCKLCGDALTTSDERKLHYLLRHPGRHPFPCGLCPRSFPYKSSLYAHRAEHADHVAHACPHCGKTFMKKDSFREHLAIHLGPRHACSYCPRRFVQRSNMLRHERRHTGERPYSCNTCSRTFSDRGAATSHARTHSKDRSFKCAYCGQAFAQKSKLTYHTRKHTGENLETCSVCGKLFTSACALREHARTHDTAAKVVPCPLCERKFFDERAMARHVRGSHGAGGAPRACPLCPRSCPDAAALRVHLPSHCTTNIFQCKFCSASYAVKRSMISHLQRRHQLGGAAGVAAAGVHYGHRDVRDAGLADKLDEETIFKIFGPRRTDSDAALSDHVSAARPLAPPPPRPAGTQEIAHVTVKMEPCTDDEMEPTDFVSVKIEPADEDGGDS